MNGESKKYLYLLLTFVLTIFIILPEISFGEDNLDTLIPEQSIVDKQIVESLETIESGIVNDLKTESLINESDIATTSIESLDIFNPDKDPVIVEVENIIEDNVESNQSIIVGSTIPPPPRLITRHFRKRVIIDDRAVHSCQAGAFRVDVSKKDIAIVNLFLRNRDNLSNELEIGSLPKGINVKIFKNDSYIYRPKQDEMDVAISIKKQLGAQKGDFSVPIFFASGESTVVCQINIVNLN